MMNIIYSSDNNYARHVGISITSLYEHNQSEPELMVYLIDDGISEENHRKLDEVASRYGRKITYVPFDKHKQRLILNNEKEMPISAYARLFVQDMVPESVDRLLYLDCDTVVCDSLTELWTLDLHGKTIAAVEDVCSCMMQEETLSPQPYRYICSGVVLFDMKRWRERKAQQLCLDYLDHMHGTVRHHDQTILNGVFWDDCYLLHPRYDVLTPAFLMSYSNLKAYFKLWDRYYSKNEVLDSVKRPAIIHYTSSDIGRPWETSRHPKAGIYQKYWEESPWKNEPWCEFRDRLTTTERRTLWLYRYVPVGVIRFVSKVRRLVR